MLQVHDKVELSLLMCLLLGHATHNLLNTCATCIVVNCGIYNGSKLIEFVNLEIVKTLNNTCTSHIWLSASVIPYCGSQLLVTFIQLIQIEHVVSVACNHHHSVHN